MACARCQSPLSACWLPSRRVRVNPHRPRGAPLAVVDASSPPTRAWPRSAVPALSRPPGHGDAAARRRVRAVALLPSVQARQVYDTVNALARAAGSDDIRTMDQRRADALFDLLCGRAEPPQVSIAVTVPADVLLGKSAEPGDVCGVGAVTSSEVLGLTGVAPEGLPDGDAIPGGVTFRRLLVDPETGVLHRYRRASVPTISQARSRRSCP